MITYELAKQLKEAGFPFRIFRDADLNYSSDEIDGKAFGQNVMIVGDKVVFLPTLSELIDACGKEFYGLMRDGIGWIAKAGDWNKSEIQIITAGLTPKEAVAKLWLRLNK